MIRDSRVFDWSLYFKLDPEQNLKVMAANLRFQVALYFEENDMSNVSISPFDYKALHTLSNLIFLEISSYRYKTTINLKFYITH